MQKTKQTSTKLLGIVITTAAIIAATTTIGAATPAFAQIDNCTTNPTGEFCSGGTSFKAQGEDAAGGGGGRNFVDSDAGLGIISGGGGRNTDLDVGGFGAHSTCDQVECTLVGGIGLHPK
jgi:hypothetical protein